MKKKILYTSHTANFQKFNRPFMRMLRGTLEAPYDKYNVGGWEVHYAAGGDEEILDADRAFVVDFARSPLRLDKHIRAYRQMKKILGENHYDIIHTHTPVGSVITRLAARGARKSGTRVIYTAHGFHFYKGASLLNWLLWYPVEKIMAHFTDDIITINTEDYERAKKKLKTRIHYTHGVGVDPKKFQIKMTQKERDAYRAGLGLAPDDFVMIYVAEISKRKNQEGLLRQKSLELQKDKKKKILLVGMDSLSGKIQKLAKKLGIDNQVMFLGYRQDIPQLLKISDLYISTSRQEGLAANLLEARVSGLKIEASKCRGHEAITVKDIAIFYLTNILHEYRNIYDDDMGLVMHILPSSNYGGAENMICLMAKEGGDIYCSPGGDITNILKGKGIRYESLEKFTIRNIRRVVKKHNPNTIIAHDFRASILCGAFFGGRLKVVSYLHQNPDWLDRVSMRMLLYRLLTRRFSRIITVTKAIAERKILNGFPPSKIETRYNKVDIAEITRLSNEVLDKKYDLCFVGRLEIVKQPLHFIELVGLIRKTTPMIRAVIVGDGSLKESVNSEIKKRGLTGNVDVVGFQNNPYKFIKNASFLVIVSKDEGFSLVSLEAITLGTLFVAYDYPIWFEIFGNSSAKRALVHNGIVEMADAILDIKSNKELYERLLKEAKRSYEAL